MGMGWGCVGRGACVRGTGCVGKGCMGCVSKRHIGYVGEGRMEYIGKGHIRHAVEAVKYGGTQVQSPKGMEALHA